MTREIEVLVKKKKEPSVRQKQLRSSEFLEDERRGVGGTRYHKVDWSRVSWPIGYNIGLVVAVKG